MSGDCKFLEIEEAPFRAVHSMENVPWHSISMLTIAAFQKKCYPRSVIHAQMESQGDVLLLFRWHCISLTSDVSKMYHLLNLTETCTVQLTFGVSASCFAANMAVKQNAIDFSHKFLLAAKAVEQSFYVDDGLMRSRLPLLYKISCKVCLLVVTSCKQRVDWDDSVPEGIKDSWRRWRSELPDLSLDHTSHGGVFLSSFMGSVMPRRKPTQELCICGSPTLQVIEDQVCTYQALVNSMLGARSVVLKSMPSFFHMSKKFSNLPMVDVFAWTDSTIILSWLTGNPRRFKTYIGNRVSLIVDQIPPDWWNHVIGAENPADCASSPGSLSLRAAES